MGLAVLAAMSCGGHVNVSQVYGMGPLDNVQCCKSTPNPDKPCAIDCQASGYNDGVRCQVGNADEWDTCSIFVVNGLVEVVWVNWD